MLSFMLNITQKYLIAYCVVNIHLHIFTKCVCTFSRQKYDMNAPTITLKCFPTLLKYIQMGYRYS